MTVILGGSLSIPRGDGPSRTRYNAKQTTVSKLSMIVFHRTHVRVFGFQWIPKKRQCANNYSLAVLEPTQLIFLFLCYQWNVF